MPRFINPRTGNRSRGPRTSRFIAASKIVGPALPGRILRGREFDGKRRELSAYANLEPALGFKPVVSLPSRRVPTPRSAESAAAVLSLHRVWQSANGCQLYGFASARTTCPVASDISMRG